MESAPSRRNGGERAASLAVAMLSVSRFLAIAALLVAAPGCSRNPATGRVEALVPKQPEEIALGQEAALQIDESVVVLDEAERATTLLDRVGSKIASTTERGDLPWTFTLVDDPEPNAFALPGGSIYVTRGLMTYLGRESELAAVLAHECAHVAARHGVRRLQRIANQQNRNGRSSLEVQLPAVNQIGTKALARLLEHSRDEELLADELALRYIKRANYPALALADVLEMLGTLHGGPGLEHPGTHPTTVRRRALIHRAVGRATGSADDDAGYLAVIDGMRFGPDPRQGYFKDDHFVHPDMGFSLRLPEHWTVEYRGGRAVAKNLASDTYLVVSESRAESVRAGMNEVFLRDVGKKDPWEGQLLGSPAAMAEFSTVHGDRPIHAFVGFIEFDGKIIQVVAFSSSAQWPAKETREVFKSFAAATSAQKSVDPMRIELMEVDKTATLAEIYKESPSSVPLQVIARINHLDPGDEVVAGRKLKRVRGFNPDFKSVRPGLRP